MKKWKYISLYFFNDDIHAEESFTSRKIICIIHKFLVDGNCSQKQHNQDSHKISKSITITEWRRLDACSWLNFSRYNENFAVVAHIKVYSNFEFFKKGLYIFVFYSISHTSLTPNINIYYCMLKIKWNCKRGPSHYWGIALNPFNQVARYVPRTATDDSHFLFLGGKLKIVNKQRGPFD